MILLLRFFLLVLSMNLVALRYTHPESTGLLPFVTGGLLMAYLLLGERRNQ